MCHNFGCGRLPPSPVSSFLIKKIEFMITVFQWFLISWALVKILDLIIEMFSIFGGDGVQPYDVMFWITRPFSFRSISIVRLPMLVGILVWFSMILGTGWAVDQLMFN